LHELRGDHDRITWQLSQAFQGRPWNIGRRELFPY
jgi:hypothetical protein